MTIEGIISHARKVDGAGVPEILEVSDGETFDHKRSPKRGVRVSRS